ncbi:MAG: hypothetical protein VKL41_13750 [Snowella sp.]|nr:hypothetical protein [Snowella sp.]
MNQASIEANVLTQKETIAYPQLPLAVYREISAHLQQVESVKTVLISQASTQFDYAQSQIEAVQIEYPVDLSNQEKQYLEAILEYYSQKYGKYQRQLDSNS